jgi:hypothetical protein
VALVVLYSLLGFIVFTVMFKKKISFKKSLLIVFFKKSNLKIYFFLIKIIVR